MPWLKDGNQLARLVSAFLLGDPRDPPEIRGQEERTAFNTLLPRGPLTKPQLLPGLSFGHSSRVPEYPGPSRNSWLLPTRALQAWI